MGSIALVGFPADTIEQVEAGLFSAGLGATSEEVAISNRKEGLAALRADSKAALVSADAADWLRTVCEIRASYPQIFLMVVTRQPDYGKWLDAMESGADDYCCLPLDGHQIQWLFQSRGGFRPRAAARMATA